LEILVPVLVVLGIGLGIAGAIAAWRAHQRRREELTAFAEEHGGRISFERDRRFERRFPHFDCLREGDDRRADMVIEGTHQGRPFVAFDYHYSRTSGTGKDRRTTHYHFSGVILECAFAFEPLTWRCETVFDRVSAFFGMNDIQFELTEFNRAFHVRAKDRRFATDAIQPSTMEFLLGAPRFHVECETTQMCVWRTTRFGAAEFRQALELAHGFLERLPPSLVVERKRTPAWTP
jgi:hypothetical protein